jgi:hypothetical protein
MGALTIFDRATGIYGTTPSEARRPVPMSNEELPSQRKRASWLRTDLVTLVAGTAEAA